MKTRAIHHAVIIGAGTMGHGIAQIVAMSGCHVVLCDLRQEFIDKGLALIRKNLEKGVARGKVDPDVCRETLLRLSGSVDAPAAMATADLVVEAVPEDQELKLRVLSEMGRHAGAHALLATNTSSLPLSGLASALPDPSRFIGLHFFNPPHIMRLVEIVVAKETSPATVEQATRLVARLGKEAIVVRDVPGFATSRLGLAIGLEAMRMLEEGVASAADIDRAMELGYNHPMGPLKLSDLVGLDVRLGISRTLARELDPVRFEPPEILLRKVREGRLGKKTGEGFYRWTVDGPEPLE
ncbi:MAG: 3-hydroxyacyl-CoA dehydrogenase family protein [Acidobacteria bacterium]|nr:MAG: 3-hydroxyacyl-CoA dehydrogenase family protein [Acidobacteriota bacterium]